MENQDSILRPVSGDPILSLGPLDGSRLIRTAENTFKGGIDLNLAGWTLFGKPGIATPKTRIRVDEVVGDGMFKDIFLALPDTWNQRWLSQHQVIGFCETLPDWLRLEGFGNMFLIKKDENKPVDENKLDDNLAVVLVRVRPNKDLFVRIFPFLHDYPWRAENLHRVFYPVYPAV